MSKATHPAYLRILAKRLRQREAEARHHRKANATAEAWPDRDEEGRI